MNKVQHPWIIQGYQTFATEGPFGLKVEQLAKAVGKNKSSFYHHFSDLDIFTTVLLDAHFQQTIVMAEKEAECTTVEELLDVLVDHKIDLLFNRQLRVHRQRSEFQQCFQKTNKVIVSSLTPIWFEVLELPNNSYLAGLVFKLSLENFYLQITEDTLNHTWLRSYLHELRTLIRAFKNANFSTADGTV
jgi:AcrR family transcriptional regulator